MSLPAGYKTRVEKSELVQDGVERNRERPKDEVEQKKYYSGKKNTYGEKSDNRRG